MNYRRQSPYTDPRGHRDLIASWPADLPGLSAVVRDLVVHYRASGIAFPDDRLAEIDSRWADRLLDHVRPAPRAPEDRIVGCCRDFTLLTVSALRAHGIPARSRVGFASYFHEGYHGDHVVTEWFDGTRWIAADAELDPAGPWPFDTLDLPLGPGGLVPAAQVWQQYRRGEIDVDTYGVGPGLPYAGAWFVRNYVLHELAHRRGDELLLWDTFGAMSMQLDGDLALIDEVAALLQAADAGDEGAERRLARWYAEDDRLHPGRTVVSHSPRGVVAEVDLTRG